MFATIALTSLVALGFVLGDARPCAAQTPSVLAGAGDDSADAPRVDRQDVPRSVGRARAPTHDVHGDAPRRRDVSVDATPWALLGSGAAIAALGAILLGVGYADLANAQRSNVSYASIADSALRAPIETAGGWIALPVGLALAGVGLALVLTERPGHPSATMRLSPMGVAIGGDF
jgi:hypothetical protein